MENNHTEPVKYQFLTDSAVQRHFSDLNIELLRGVHITLQSRPLFDLLDQWYDELAGFYLDLYGLNLEKRNHEGCTFYYLEFPPAGKGRLSYGGLYKELEDKQVIVGFVLSSLYLSKYFYVDKKFQWEDIRHEIEYGENKDAYQQLFFKEIRPEYSDKEWENTRKEFNAVVNFFGRMGLLEKDPDAEDMQFTILPTIYHFIEMYNNEIQNIDKIAEDLKS
jgi:hypothetical protein